MPSNLGDAMTLYLYHHNTSVCAAKVRVALAEKSLHWESRLLNLDGDQLDPAYLALNPEGVVPTLVHRGRAITESNVILEFLDDEFELHPLRPRDPFARAQARLLMHWQSESPFAVHHAASVATYAISYRNRLIADAGSNEEKAISELMARTMTEHSRIWLKDVIVHGVQAPEFKEVLQRIVGLLDEFERRLSVAPWLAGDSYSIADAAYTPYMVRFAMMKLDRLWATSNRPAVFDWYGRLLQRESTKAVFEWYDTSVVQKLQSHGLLATSRIAEIMEELNEDYDAGIQH